MFIKKMMMITMIRHKLIEKLMFSNFLTSVSDLYGFCIEALAIKPTFDSEFVTCQLHPSHTISVDDSENTLYCTSVGMKFWLKV